MTHAAAPRNLSSNPKGAPVANPRPSFAARRGVAVSVLMAIAGGGAQPLQAEPVADPGNVIIAILDDVSIDELSVYAGYPLADACETECACQSSSSACDACTAPPSCEFPDFSDDLPDTPFLDALAEDGVVFKNAYSNTVCTPTRSTMQTGRYAFRTGVGTFRRSNRIRRC